MHYCTVCKDSPVLPAAYELDEPRPAAEPWREVKKRKTHEALVTAARTQVTGEGLDAVTIDDICHEAGVSRRTFFNYFETKEDAVLDLPGHGFDPDSAAAFCGGGPTGELSQDVRALVHGLLEKTTDRFDEFRTLMPIIHAEPRLLARQVRWFDEQVAAVRALVEARFGPCAEHLRSELVALGVVGLVRASVLSWEAHDLTGSPADYVDVAAGHLRDVFAARP